VSDEPYERGFHTSLFYADRALRMAGNQTDRAKSILSRHDKHGTLGYDLAKAALAEARLFQRHARHHLRQAKLFKP
jgi:hypothetical protein